ncbi:MAG: hypothetical protein FJ386_04680 [Verrucomicrobia bacterium]|nr:hypothetical protein [Verrucomicrobiota bacterium]
MNWNPFHSTLRGRLKPVAAVSLAGIIVWLAVFSGTSALHAEHHEDGSSSHLCAVCHFTKGGVIAADASPILGTVLLVVTIARTPVFRLVPSSSDVRLAPGRAPPRFSCTPSR